MCNIPNAVNSDQLKVTPTELIKEHKGNRIKLLSWPGKLLHMKSSLMKKPNYLLLSLILMLEEL